MAPPARHDADEATPAPGARLAQALCDPRAYPAASAGAEAVEHIETHVSHVFLIAGLAYKIKKPVNLGFLDFSTLAQRRHACEEELRINRRLAPQVYLAVVPIAGSCDAPRVEGEGPAIEYAVKMRRFAQTDVFDQVAAQGRLLPRHVDEMASQLAAFHGEAGVAAADSGFGSPQQVFDVADQNFVQLAALLGETHAAALAQLRAWTRAQGAQLESVLLRRRAQGHVRECHGDLHLGNIAMFEGEIVMFDALEFDAALRWTDTMNDVAFLSMDLHAQGRPDLAARFIDAYLAHGGDYAGVTPLRFFQVYRAMVRAKVAALRARQDAGDEAGSRAATARCTAPLELAATLARPRPGMLVLLHGVSGSGKTWGAQRMLEATGALRIRSDVERKRAHGLHALASSGSASGAGLYASSVTQDTYARLAALAREIVRAGYPVLVDATFLRASQRAPFLQLAREERVPVRIASFTADEAILRARVQARQAAGGDASEATLEVLEQQLRTREPLSAAEAAIAVQFDTGRMSEAQIAHAARALMGVRPARD